LKNTVNEEQQKQVLVLFGSPHQKGTTARLLDSFLAPFAADAQIHTVNAYACNIAPCNGCNICRTAERCAMTDFDEIDGLIRRSDVIVVATPVYNLSFPAPLKAIVDRTQRYFSARFSLGLKPSIAKHKLAALLVTAGSLDLDGAEIISRQMKMVFSVMNTEIEGMAVWTGTDFNQGEKGAAKAQESARNLALAIKSKL
jgi:multimeric flavodoxin WrbA